jgi:predicted flap endonuclease-1-like 5' DNA nuclease
MKAIGAFLLGLFSGWLVKSMIADADWRHRIQAFAGENAFLKDRIRSLELQIKPKSPEAKSRTRPVIQPVEQPRPVETDTGKDDLKLLKGVGPAIEKRLNNAGIYTFADIVQLTPQELQEMLGNTRRVPASNLIAEAKKLARQK